MSYDVKSSGMEEIGRTYSMIRSRAPSDEALTVLHIGADGTLVATGTGTEAAAVLALDIGSGRTGSAFFHHAPPTPVEVENAINLVEDEVTRAYAVTGTGSTLCTTDGPIREIARLAGVPDRPELTLSRGAMEALFSRFAALSLGRPAARDPLRVDAPFAATLLILREFMHHLGFPSIRVM